jgi:hypothetical protein
MIWPLDLIKRPSGHADDRRCLPAVAAIPCRSASKKAHTDPVQAFYAARQWGRVDCGSTSNPVPLSQRQNVLKRLGDNSV